MQATAKVPGQQAPVKIYNAVYSSVQVYECMVRGIAVMRRRADSYVNATQILKVAGVDKGRRTKILEKEILPGKHEIVQGGYGKYQGTWIPLERGRDIAMQYGVAPLLSPLFDFVPNTNAIGALPPGMPSTMSGVLAPPPIMPGSALRLLNQGRAQGLFTPSTSTLNAQRPPGYASSGAYYMGNGFPGTPSPYSSMPGISPTPPPAQQQPLKRARSETSADTRSPFPLAASPDIQSSRPPSTVPHEQEREADGQPPTKRTRTDPSGETAPNSPGLFAVNGMLSRPDSSQSLHALTNGKAPQLEATDESQDIRFATKATVPHGMDLTTPLSDGQRSAIVAHICQHDQPSFVLESLRAIAPDNPALPSDIDIILDDQGHTALHLAASMARHDTVAALLAEGADMHRGNYNGETPLVRATLATANYDNQTFHILVAALHSSIRTLDTSKKSVIHHVVSSAGVKGRALAARYYLEQIFFWIAQRQGGDFKSLVDLQDEHGDTALNIAARVGNRSIVRTLMDVGANRILPNKLGLRPGDFGVETEELGGAPRAEDLLSSLRTGPSAPMQKSQDVLADIQGMINGLSADFAAEIKSKQDALDLTQAHLRAATRSLAEQRKQIHMWQAECAELDLVAQRSRNLEKALEGEDSFDWTGRTEVDGTDAGARVGPAFRYRGPGSMQGINGSVKLPFAQDEDSALPATDSTASLIRLRRIRMWQLRMDDLVRERVVRLGSASAEKEFQCKKIVSLCTGVPMDKVEEMLENLVVAVESEAQVIDIGRVSGFMQKVRNGTI